jgi:predicted nucleotidyltransferase component of viral defense system
MFKKKVLNSNQIGVISKLGFLKDKSIYLGGGTALAIQIGHRTSVDLDFFSEQEPQMQLAVSGLQKSIGNIVIKRAEKHTLFAEAGDTDISLFYYPYKLLNPLIEVDSLYLASVEDIIAMKMAAIIQRGTRRDFIDIFYLMGMYNVGQILEFTKRKFSGYQDVMALKALVYFDENFSWEAAKRKIFEEVEGYQLHR